MAALHGLSPAPIESCRVLEIGCSEGGNLIPMAYALPGATFTGFDLAAQPIARGQERIRHLGLQNIRLFQADLTSVASAPDQGGLGEFDYILAHGLYSWMQAPVRDRLLGLCAEHLAPQGIAFISYNALPGAPLRRIMRDAIQLRPEPAPSLSEQIDSGLQLLST